jgi:malto-oligosyltrehalose trehalohydrolase
VSSIIAAHDELNGSVHQCRSAGAGGLGADRLERIVLPARGDPVAQAGQAGAEGTAMPARSTDTTRRAHRMPFGAQILANGAVRFRVWAPGHAAIALELEGGSAPLPMAREAAGWHGLVTDAARAGSRYRFVLPDGLRVADPASRYQPADVHGPSEVIDPASYPWRDGGWRGRPWHEAVLYELHIGTFTPAGTFRSTIERLDHLVALGVTALQIMPVADFPGRRNWGYDGVLPFAPDAAYGRPEDFKALIEAAHERGVMVLLDVVYNHFGPDGNCLHALAPEFFADRHRTLWGAAIGFDGPASRPVRDFFVENALYWLAEFHLDGLRLDAVHAIRDDSAVHILDELAARVGAAFLDRRIHLVLENEGNEAHHLERTADGAPRSYTAQWNDDVHHVLHVAATGEGAGYYADYRSDTAKLARALAEGFAFQGELMPYRGHPRGQPSGHLPPSAFVAFVQNHDQIGNRAFGERLSALAPCAAVRACGAVLLLLPQIPMLFMGEEWDADQPFLFLCDFGAALADAVREGRCAEFARFPAFANPATRARIPDPLAEATVAASTLRWEALDETPHSQALAWHRRILALRHAELVPRLPRIRRGGAARVIGDGAAAVRWRIEDGGTLALEANLSPRAVAGFAPPRGRVLWQEGAAEGGSFAPWSVRWSIDDG